MSKPKIVDIEVHALLRVLQRGAQHHLDYHETKERAFRTARLGRLARRKHLSRKHKTYYQYFHDNLSFYVICKEKEFDLYIKMVIKTVIIERGRE